MAKAKLTELQLAILRTLWSRGGATANEVHAETGTVRGLAPATIATLLRRLEKRGFVTHETVGRQYVYRASISPDDARRSVLDEVIDKLLPGDLPTLVHYLVAEGSVSADDLARMKAMIEEKERELEERE
jgi:BlaI family transcriptional regulator, penicillinase repressor